MEESSRPRGRAKKPASKKKDVEPEAEWFRYVSELETKSRLKPKTWNSKERIPVSEELETFLEDDLAIRTYGQLGKIEVLFERTVLEKVKEIFKLKEMFEKIGCAHLLNDGENIYPNLLQQFYAHLEYHKHRNKIKSLVKGVKIELTPKLFGEILKVPHEGKLCTFPSANFAQCEVEKELFPTLPEFTDKIEYEAYQMDNLSKVLNRFSQFNIFPKGSHFPMIRKDVMEFIYWLKKGEKVDVASLMFTRFCEPTGFYIYFPCYLTRVFKHFEVDFENEPFVENDYKFGMEIVRKVIAERPRKMEELVEEKEETVTLNDILREVAFTKYQNYHIQEQNEDTLQGINRTNEMLCKLTKTKHVPIKPSGWEFWQQEYDRAYGKEGSESPSSPASPSTPKTRRKGKEVEVEETPKKKKDKGVVIQETPTRKMRPRK